MFAISQKLFSSCNPYSTTGESPSPRQSPQEERCSQMFSEFQKTTAPFSSDSLTAIARRRAQRKTGVLPQVWLFFEKISQNWSKTNYRVCHRELLLLSLVISTALMAESLLGQMALSWRSLDAERSAQERLLTSYSLREIERKRLLDSWNDDYEELFEKTLGDLEEKHAFLIDQEMGRYLKRHKCDPVDQLARGENRCNFQSFRYPPSFSQGLNYSLHHTWLTLDPEDVYKKQITGIFGKREWRLFIYCLFIVYCMSKLQSKLLDHRIESESEEVSAVKKSKKKKGKKKESAGEDDHLETCLLEKKQLIEELEKQVAGMKNKLIYTESQWKNAQEAFYDEKQKWALEQQSLEEKVKQLNFLLTAQTQK